MSALPTSAETKQAAVRIAIRQMTKTSQVALATLIARGMNQDNEDGRKMAMHLIQGPLGTGVIHGVLSLALPMASSYVGEEYKTKLEALASELKISAMTEVGDATLETVMAPARGLLFDMMANGSLKKLLDDMPAPQLGEKTQAASEAIEAQSETVAKLDIRTLWGMPSNSFVIFILGLLILSVAANLIMFATMARLIVGMASLRKVHEALLSRLEQADMLIGELPRLIAIFRTIDNLRGRGENLHDRSGLDRN